MRVGREIQIHFDVREGRLVSQVLGKASIKADGVVDAVGGPHHGTAGSLPGEAQMRGKVIAVRRDQRAGIFHARDAADLVWPNGSDPGKTGIVVERRKAIVFFRIGRKVVIAQPREQGEVGQRSPVVPDEAVPVILTHVGFLSRRLDVVSCGSPSRKSANDEPVTATGFVLVTPGCWVNAPVNMKVAGGVRAAKQIELDAADIPAKANECASPCSQEVDADKPIACVS